MSSDSRHGKAREDGYVPPAGCSTHCERAAAPRPVFPQNVACRSLEKACHSIVEYPVVFAPGRGQHRHRQLAVTSRLPSVGQRVATGSWAAGRALMHAPTRGSLADWRPRPPRRRTSQGARCRRAAAMWPRGRAATTSLTRQLRRMWQRTSSTWRTPTELPSIADTMVRRFIHRIREAAAYAIEQPLHAQHSQTYRN